MNLNEAESKRWFSTGFMSGGVTSVDAEKHTLHGAVLIRPGEALGHGMWIDKEFCQAVAALSANGKSAMSGLKARFGHPNMCSDALGTFLGRWKNITVDEQGFVRGDLFLSSTASESPKGDLRKYVEEMAAKEPNHFGASIVFSTDWKAFEDYAKEHGAVEKQGMYGAYLDFETFKSPDPDNLKNLPHARIAELHAADLVDDPAATDGMFSGAGGAALASQMTEWLDTHPEVFAALKEPGVLDLVSRYSNELKPFVERYQSLATIVETTTTVTTDDTESQEQESEPAAESATEEQPSGAAAESEQTQTSTGLLTAQVESLGKAIEQLTVERDGLATRAESAEVSNSTLNAEREQLAARVATLELEVTGITTERDEYKRKFETLSAGQLPASSVPAPESSKGGTLMERARAAKK